MPGPRSDRVAGLARRGPPDPYGPAVFAAADRTAAPRAASLGPPPETSAGAVAECTAAPRALSLGPPGVGRTPVAAVDAAIPRRLSFGPLCRLTLVLDVFALADPDCWSPHKCDVSPLTGPYLLRKWVTATG
jgi:hypothetical protein